MDSIDREAVLEEACLALSVGKSIYKDKLNWRLHALAEAGDEVAKAFFVTTLRSEESDWRLEAVCNLGFHYDLEPDVAIVAEIRRLLASDPDDDVRLSSAAVLGIRSVWPDRVLYRAMTDDSDEFVRRSAFESLLRLSGKSFKEVWLLREQIEAGKLAVTPDSLKALLDEKFTDLL